MKNAGKSGILPDRNELAQGRYIHVADAVHQSISTLERGSHVMTNTEHQPSEHVAPIQFLYMDHLKELPAPFVRITTCGLLSLAILKEVVPTDPPQARYQVFTPEHLHGRGPAPALMLLKLLVSRPQRFALRDWLMQQFCHERELFSNVRLDNIASQLRSLLCPETYEGLRTRLVAHARSRSDSGDGFQLASYPLIWIDHEALAWNVEQAARMERFGDDPLPFWEHAYALAKGGDYLPDVRYSDWATERREEVAGMRKQSVRALARLYQERHGKAGEEEALLLLRSYWHEHPREEDVLRPLMELLARHDCYQEALDSYERLGTLLKEEDRQPDPHTQDVVTFVRTKQIQRQPLIPATSPFTKNGENFTQQWLFPEKSPLHFTNDTAPIVPDKILSLHLLMPEQATSFPLEQHRKAEGSSEDLLRSPSSFPDSSGAVLHTSPTLDSRNPREEDIALLENELLSRWMLYYTGGAVRAALGFTHWLREVRGDAQQRKLFSERVLLVLCMSYQLQGCILRDMMHFPEAHKAFRQALLVAQELHSPELIAATLAREGILLLQQEKSLEAIDYLKRALELVKYLDLLRLEGYILQALSEAQARCQLQASWESLDCAERLLGQKSQMREHSSTHFNAASVLAQRGVNAALLHDYEQSVNLIDTSLKSYDATLVRGRARLLIQKAEAYWKLEELEACAQSLQEAFHFAQSVGASKTIARAKNLHAFLLQSPWGKEQEIAELREGISSDHR